MKSKIRKLLYCFIGVFAFSFVFNANLKFEISRASAAEHLLKVDYPYDSLLENFKSRPPKLEHEFQLGTPTTVIKTEEPIKELLGTYYIGLRQPILTLSNIEFATKEYFIAYYSPTTEKVKVINEVMNVERYLVREHRIRQNAKNEFTAEVNKKEDIVIIFYQENNNKIIDRIISFDYKLNLTNKAKTWESVKFDNHGELFNNNANYFYTNPDMSQSISKAHIGVVIFHEQKNHEIKYDKRLKAYVTDNINFTCFSSNKTSCYISVTPNQPMDLLVSLEGKNKTWASANETIGSGEENINTYFRETGVVYVSIFNESTNEVDHTFKILYLDFAEVDIRNIGLTKTEMTYAVGIVGVGIVTVLMIASIKRKKRIM